MTCDYVDVDANEVSKFREKLFHSREELFLIDDILLSLTRASRGDYELPIECCTCSNKESTIARDDPSFVTLKEKVTAITDIQNQTIHQFENINKHFASKDSIIASQNEQIRDLKEKILHLESHQNEKSFTNETDQTNYTEVLREDYDMLQDEVTVLKQTVSTSKLHVEMLSRILSMKANYEKDLQNNFEESKFLSLLKQEKIIELGISREDIEKRELILRDIPFHYGSFRKIRAASEKIKMLQKDVMQLEDNRRQRDIDETVKIMGLERDVVVARNYAQLKEIELVGMKSQCKNLKKDHQKVLSKIRQMELTFRTEGMFLCNDEEDILDQKLDNDALTKPGKSNSSGSIDIAIDTDNHKEGNSVSHEKSIAEDSERGPYDDILLLLEQIEKKFRANNAAVGEAKKAMKTSEQDLQTALRHYSELVAEHEEKMERQANLFLISGFGCSEADNATYEGGLIYDRAKKADYLSGKDEHINKDADSDTFVASETVASDTEVELGLSGHISGLDSSGNEHDSFDNTDTCSSSSREQDSIDSHCIETTGCSSVEVRAKDDLIDKYNLSMAKIEVLERKLFEAQKEAADKQFEYKKRENDLKQLISRQEKVSQQHALALKKIEALEEELKKSKKLVTSKQRKMNQAQELATKQIATLKKEVNKANREIVKLELVQQSRTAQGTKKSQTNQKSLNESGNNCKSEVDGAVDSYSNTPSSIETLERKLLDAQREADGARSRQEQKEGQLRDLVFKCKKMNEEYEVAMEQIKELKEELEMSKKELRRREGASIGTRKRLSECYSQLKTLELDYNEALERIEVLESELEENRQLMDTMGHAGTKLLQEKDKLAKENIVKTLCDELMSMVEGKE